jgi:putative two-component system response regulator
MYNALISIRPYKGAFTHEDAVAIIAEGSGTQFDPILVDAFNRIAEKFRV